jgi:hypothetical protein
MLRPVCFHFSALLALTAFSTVLYENDAAIAAYRKVTPPKAPINPIDTYNLAQTHLKNLHAN